MKSTKLWIPIIAMLYSCDNSKKNLETQSNTIINHTNEQIIDTSMQNKIDSNYLENVKEIEAYPYATVFSTKLKGGFSISYYYDKELQYLLYKKDEKVIDTLNSCSLGLPYKNLGYIGADFDNTFVFVNSFGIGNPNYIFLYDKETLKSLIPNGSVWIDVDTLKGVLLYSKAGVPYEKDKMTLFDTKKMTEEDYVFPIEIFDEEEILDRISLLNITDETFFIEYKVKNRTKTKKKKYSR